MNLKVAIFYGIFSFLLGVNLKLLLHHHRIENKLLILIGEVIMGVFSSFLISSEHESNPDPKEKKTPRTFRQSVEIKWISFKQNFDGFIYLSLLYSCNTMTAVISIHRNHITIFGAFRRCLCLCVLIFSLLSRKEVKKNELLPIFIITAGAIITAPDLEINNVFGYLFVFLHNFITVAMLEYSNFLKKSRKITRGESIFHINFGVICVMLVIFGLRIGNGTFRVSEIIPTTSLDFWGLFLSLIVVCYFHQNFQFECSHKNSAFIVGVTSIFKDIFTTLFGIFVFRDVAISLKLVIGLLISFAGAFWYSVLVAKKKDLESKNHKIEEDDLKDKKFPIIYKIAVIALFFFCLYLI